jgi:hypothetical protein
LPTLTKIHKFIGTLAQEIESFDWNASVQQADCMKWFDDKKKKETQLLAAKQSDEGRTFPKIG